MKKAIENYEKPKIDFYGTKTGTGTGGNSGGNDWKTGTGTGGTDVAGCSKRCFGGKDCWWKISADCTIYYNKKKKSC